MTFHAVEKFLSDVKHQVKNSPENANISQQRKTSGEYTPLFAFYARACFSIEKHFEKIKVLGDVFLSNGLIDT